jgi:hypothetical protein
MMMQLTELMAFVELKKLAVGRYGSTGSYIEAPGGRGEEASGDEATTLNLGPASYLASAPTDGTG